MSRKTSSKILNTAQQVIDKAISDATHKADITALEQLDFGAGLFPPGTDPDERCDLHLLDELVNPPVRKPFTVAYRFPLTLPPFKELESGRIVDRLRYHGVRDNLAHDLARSSAFALYSYLQDTTPTLAAKHEEPPNDRTDEQSQRPE